jgi:hypothetical protein
MPVPRPTDETPNSLPDPELNPLLNPVLGAHMGRWAEVYFTAPPEKREEAVSELLRELRKDSPPESASIASDANVHSIESANILAVEHAKNEENSERAALEQPPLESSAIPIEPALMCDVCAYQNAAGQLFCGMCGSRLEVKPEPAIPQVLPVAPISNTRWSEAESAPVGNFDEEKEAELSTTAKGVQHYDMGPVATEPVAAEPVATEAVAAEPAASEPAAVESVWTLPHRSLPSFAMAPEPESAPYRYRIYIGAAVAIFLMLLLYMGWRGTQAMSGAAGTHSTEARTIPPAPPAEVSPTPAEQAAASAPAPASSPSIAPAPSAQPGASARASSEDAPPHPSTTATLPKATPPASKARSEKPPARTARRTQPAATRRQAPATMAASSSPMVADSNGAEELASAEKYLNGSPRNSREAAQWLWKAVGKGNVAATISLSDLYLRGDGVTKSCDQARLLLDAAARKGGRAAGERLRNLQAFGCN